MKYLHTLALIIAFFLIVCPANSQKRLAIIGSSTSACYGASVYDSCYVGRLHKRYNQQETFYATIDNAYAVPGYCCLKGMPSSYVSPYANLQPDPEHNITKALSVHPDVVLVNYPNNGYDSLHIDLILYCLRTIRDSANKAGVPCFVTTTQPRTSAPLFNNPAAKLKLAILKDSILAEFGYFAVDFYTGLYNPADSSVLYDAGDHTHMNNTGHDSLFQRVLAKNIFFAILPATFLQFNTVYKNKTNIITWVTARGSDAAYYEIERSADGTNFTKIGTIYPTNDYDNNQYQFTDDQVLNGWNYYKIQIVGKDGKKYASPVMRVNITTGSLAIVRAFARSSSQVMIEIQNNSAQNATIQILDNTGTVVCKENKVIEAGKTSFYLTTPLLSKGIYHVILSTAKTYLLSSFIMN